MSWRVVADADALKEGEAKAVKIAGHDIALCLLDGECFALGNICTHQHAYLSDGYVEDGWIECPLHQGRFDLRTGMALGPPVSDPVATYPAKIDKGRVWVFVA